MTKEQVLKLLEENKDERGIAHWSKTGSNKMISYGMGITQIKNLAKKIGKDHKLALELWHLPIYETRVLATVIDDPTLVTPQQVDEQVKAYDFWLLSHSYCSNLLSRVDFIKEKQKNGLKTNKTV
ncbi:MAG: DNA alkylation repair protein [bacterium]